MAIPQWCPWVRCWLVVSSTGHKRRALENPARAIAWLDQCNRVATWVLFSGWVVGIGYLAIHHPMWLVVWILLGLGCAVGSIPFGSDVPVAQLFMPLFADLGPVPANTLWEFHLRVLLQTELGRAHLSALMLLKDTPQPPAPPATPRRL